MPADSREIARRQHRTFAHFAAIQCWVSGLEGLTIAREDLERYLGLEQFKLSRIMDIINDVRPYFPYHLVVDDEKETFFVLILSRSELPRRSDSTIQRSDLWWYQYRFNSNENKLTNFNLWKKSDIEKLNDNPIITALLGKGDNQDERTMAAFSSLLSQGLISPKDIPGFEIRKIAGDSR